MPVGGPVGKGVLCADSCFPWARIAMKFWVPPGWGSVAGVVVGY